MEDTIVATNFLPIPDWFSAAVEGVGVAVTDLKDDMHRPAPTSPTLIVTWDRVV
jgi:hypothetical protein